MGRVERRLGLGSETVFSEGRGRRRLQLHGLEEVGGRGRLGGIAARALTRSGGTR